MKFKSFLVLLIFLFVINSAIAEDFLNVKYLYNYDGDTIRFNLGEDLPNIFRYINVRLYGIDTPEIKSKDEKEKQAAYQVKNFVKSELKHAQVIDLKNCRKDKYFRLLCRVEYDNKNLTEELLKNHYGYEYYGGRR